MRNGKVEGLKKTFFVFEASFGEKKNPIGVFGKRSSWTTCRDGTQAVLFMLQLRVSTERIVYKKKINEIKLSINFLNEVARYREVSSTDKK